MQTYLFQNGERSACGVAGVAVTAHSLRQARRYMRGSVYHYTGVLTEANAKRDYSNWWRVDAAKLYSEALASYVANGGGDAAYVRRDYCIPSKGE